MKHPKAIDEFVAFVSTEDEQAIVEVDEPRSADGEWMLDVKHEAKAVTLAWRAAFGFGFFDEDEIGYGSRPTEVFKRPQDACRRVFQLLSSGRQSEMMLRDLRRMRGTSQVELAQSMQITQAVISRMEAGQDVHLSSLKRYVAAMGGELEVRAKFDNFEARIGLLKRDGD